MSLPNKPQTTGNTSPTPTVSVKVFQWFEKMKDNYDQNIQQILSQFEKTSEAQQVRLAHSNTEHLVDIKNQHLIQTAQSDKTITRLESSIDDYKAQIALQQQTINQLNSRYDTVVSQLLSQPKQALNIKDIFADDDLCPNENRPTKTDTIENTDSVEALDTKIQIENF